MSGHNKWSKIKRKKGASDAKRSKIFTKILKEITIAVKESGSDPDANPRLRLALNNAKGANMPKDNIQRAINKGNETGGDNYTEVSYEGYAPGGVAVFVECTTDNINRTVSNIRMLFNKYGGNLSTKGSLSFLFERKGIFSIPKSNINDENTFSLEMIDAGAEDMELEDEIFVVYCPFENFGLIQKKLEELNIETENAELQRIPNTTVKLSSEQARKVLRLIEVIEEDDDVQNVFHNLEITEELVDTL